MSIAPRVAALLAATLVAGCSGASDAGSSTAMSSTTPTASPSPAVTASAATGGFPVTVDAGGGELTLSEPPEAIVSLSPTATETLFAVGAGDQVIAVDDQSDHPPEAPMTDLSGFQPNTEAIAGYEPDLVVVADDSGEPDGLVATLGALDVPVLVAPAVATVDEAAEQIREIGAATGHAEQADAVADEMLTTIDRLVADMPEFSEPPSVYHELDPTLYSLTSATFAGDVYQRLGASNVADGAADSSPYPQLSAEYVIEADPDVIVLADAECCGVTPEQVAERDGWADVTAVTTGNVVAVDEDVASRWGPRLAEFAELAADALRRAAG